MLDIIARTRKSAVCMRMVWLGLCAGLAVSSAAGTALARERAFALSWSAPAECPDAAAVEGYVAKDVGPIADGPTVVRARGSVSQSAQGRYTVALELDTGGAHPSSRSLEGGSCEAVSQAAALLVALAIRAQTAPTPAAVVNRAAPTPAPVAAPPRSHERPFASAAVIADLGSLPAPTIGLGVSGGATIAGLRFEPALAYFAARAGSIPGSAELGARLTLGSASARVCEPFPRSELWLAPCVGGGVDWIRARGFGARVPRDASTLDALLTAAALTGWDISPIISARLEIGAVLPLARPEYDVTELNGVSVVSRRAPVALRGNLGLELHF
jgi:hypothetical protein